MAVQLILKNSTVEDRRPTGAQLANGELSLNYNEAGPFLCCKDTDGNIQQLGGIKFNPDVPADAVTGTWWYNTATETLYVWDGTVWKEIKGGGGGGGSGITQILGDNGIDATVIGSVVALNVDIDTNKGLYFELDKLAIKAGANLSFDADGKLQADIDTLSYKGTVDLTSDPVPSAGSAGDAFVNIGSGAMTAAWQTATGLGATTVSPGDLVVKSPTAWSYIPTGGEGVQTDLGIDNRGTETLDITSSTGDDVTIPAATDALAGLMTAADKQALDSGGTPSGGTGDRPSSPNIGDTYYDTDLELLLVWNGTSWEPVSPPQAPGQWTRTGTKLAPTNPGDTVAVTAADGTEVITLNPDGSSTFALDATIHGLTVGTGGGDNTNNVAVGDSAFGSNVSGNNTVAVGRRALAANTTGTNNTGVGQNALQVNIGGSENTAIGNNVLRNNTSGGMNSGVGHLCLNGNVDGEKNTALGQRALYGNKSGSKNVAVGSQAGEKNTTGNGNIFVGESAGFFNETGDDNVYIGNSSASRVTGSNNSFIGNFIGGTPEGNVAHVFNDTISLAAGPKERLRINDAGTLLFGGGTSNWLPNKPNISLNDDGSALFKGDVAIGISTTLFNLISDVVAALPQDIKDTYASNIATWDQASAYTDVSTLPADIPTPLEDAVVRVTTAGKINLNANGTGDFAGDVTINTDKITLDATDGNISLTGDIINTTVDGDQDIICDGSGLIEVTEYNLSPMEVVTKHDIGTGANEVPVNGFLGTLAYKDDLAIQDGVLVADLPASPRARVGDITRVTDGAAALTWGATVTGGGTAQYLVWYNGTNWTVLGA